MDEDNEIVIAASASDVALLLTIEEAAERLGLGRTTMYGLVSRGTVRSVTTGRLRRVPVDCLHEYISSLLAESRNAA